MRKEERAHIDHHTVRQPVGFVVTTVRQPEHRKGEAMRARTALGVRPFSYLKARLKDHRRRHQSLYLLTVRRFGRLPVGSMATGRRPEHRKIDSLGVRPFGYLQDEYTLNDHRQHQSKSRNRPERAKSAQKPMNKCSIIIFIGSED